MTRVGGLRSPPVTSIGRTDAVGALASRPAGRSPCRLVAAARDQFERVTTTVISFSDDPAARDDFGPFTPGFRSVVFGDVAGWTPPSTTLESLGAEQPVVWVAGSGRTGTPAAATATATATGAAVPSEAAPAV